MCDLDEERVKRGSMLIRVAPFSSMALVTHLKEMGWFSAALLPTMMMQSLFWMSAQ
jgi:hypothetical protein